MKINTRVKAGQGYESQQHNQTAARALRVKTEVKPTIKRKEQADMKIKTNIKAGATNGDVHIGH